MEFRKICVGGKVYGTGTTEIGRAAALAKRAAAGGAEEVTEPVAREAPPQECQVNFNPDNPLNFTDPTLVEDLRAGDKNLHDFMLLLSLCNACIPELKSDGTRRYRAASPDE